METRKIMASLRQARVRWIGAAALAFAAIGGTAVLWAPEFALRYAVREGAALAGLQLVGLGQASVSLGAGEILLGGVELGQLKPATGAEPGLRVGSLDLRFDWRKLLAGRLELPRLHVAGLSLELVRRKDGSFAVSGVALGGETPARDAPPATDGFGLDWPIGIGVAEIVDSSLVFRDGDTVLALKIDSLKLERFAFDAQPRKLRFALAAKLGDAPFTLRGAADLQAPSFEGQVEIAGLALASLAKFAGVALGGTLDAKLDVAVARQAGGPDISLNGAASIRSLAHPAARAAAAAWNGRVRWQAAGGLALDGALTAQDFSYDADAGAIAGASLAYRGAATLGAQGALDLRGALDLVRPSVRGTDFSLEAQTLALTQAVLKRSRDGALEFGGDLAAAQVAARAPDLTVDLQTLAAAQIQATRTREGAVALRARLNLAALGLAAAGTKLRAGSLDLARLDLSVAPSGALAFGGNPVFRDVAFEQGKTAFAAQSLAADASLSRNDAALQFDGALEVGSAKFADDDLQATLAQLRYRGVLMRANDAISSTGTLGLERGSVVSKQAGLAASFAELHHEGRAALAPVPTLAGRLAGSDFTLDAADGRTLAAIGRFAASDLAADAAGTQAPRIDLENLRVLRRVAAGAGQPAFPWRLEAARAAIRDLRLEGTRAVAVNTIRIDRPMVRLTRTKEGWLSLDAAREPVPAAAPAAEQAPAAPTPIAAPAPLRYAVGRLSIVGGRALFEDRTPHAPVRLGLDRIEASVSDLDNMRPERPIAFSLAARVGGFGQANVQGTAFAFAPLLSFDLELAAKAIDLPPLSAYVDQALGIDLRTGTGDVTASLTARDELLSGTTKWRFANLQLDARAQAPDEPEPKLPVATVLGLLADSDGTIELDIPVAGKLRDPQFDTADAVRQAVGGALEGALSTTFSVLFPFGALISNALENERRGTSIVLPTLVFTAGKSDLEAAFAEPLAALETLLEKRPSAQLEVCGFAQAGEIDKAEPADLEALAAARSAAVKARLVDGGKVAASRVFECRPLVDDSANAKARVEMRFL
jgi:outer membrane protein OmpA-like peptidoglycan-associated protein